MDLRLYPDPEQAISEAIEGKFQMGCFLDEREEVAWFGKLTRTLIRLGFDRPERDRIRSLIEQGIGTL